MTHAEPLTRRDVATLERAVKRYGSLGFEASLGATVAANGRATIWYVHPRERNSNTYQLEIQKCRGQFGAAAWLIQIARSHGLDMTMRNLGEVSSNILLFALTKADLRIADERAAMERRSATIIRANKSWPVATGLTTISM